MGEIAKAVGQWMVGNLGWTVIIILFILSCLFKIAKKEIDPLGAVIGWFGKMFTKDAREDIKKLKEETDANFEQVKKDRAEKIAELKRDYNDKIADLRADLDSFEANTNKSINEMQTGTHDNCLLLQTRLDAMEKSNDMQTIRQIKAHVLDFANSCMHGREHSIEEFRNIIKENKDYNILIEKYNEKNDVYTNDYNYIMEVYNDCKKNHKFLNDNGQHYEDEE